MVHYTAGQYYGPHFDSTGREDNPRVCTVIVFLNDDFKGGATAFPVLGRRVRPETGKAVLFYNLNHDSVSHPLSWHAGQRVRSGEKFMVNQWFRQRPWLTTGHAKPPWATRRRKKRR